MMGGLEYDLYLSGDELDVIMNTVLFCLKEFIKTVTRHINFITFSVDNVLYFSNTIFWEISITCCKNNL